MLRTCVSVFEDPSFVFGLSLSSLPGSVISLHKTLRKILIS